MPNQRPYAIEEIPDFLTSTRDFLSAMDWLLIREAKGDVPRTQMAMNMSAREDLDLTTQEWKRRSQKYGPGEMSTARLPRSARRRGRRTRMPTRTLHAAQVQGGQMFSDDLGIAKSGNNWRKNSGLTLVAGAREATFKPAVNSCRVSCSGPSLRRQPKPYFVIRIYGAPGAIRTPTAVSRLNRPINPKTPSYCLASPENPAIYRPISHGSVAVTGRPVATGPQVFWFKARIAHTLPEEPTGELNDGATRFFHASALEARVHSGHQSHRWNPKMSDYISVPATTSTSSTFAQTVPLLHRALQAVSDTVAKGGRILFVGTKRQAQDGVAEAANAPRSISSIRAGSAAR